MSDASVPPKPGPTEGVPPQLSPDDHIVNRAERLKQRNFFNETLRIRDEQREKKKKAIWMIKGKYLPWEINPHGKMQWYLHPLIEDVALHTLMFYRQEIPPGSRSGRQKCQGSVVFFIEQGRGFTTIDGARHPWVAGDLVNLPLREEGVVYQHFNTDPDKPVVMVACEPNLIDALGVDKACGFEELEFAPEYLQLLEQNK